ncbi:MAG: Crp/Fnr family transcriptional regulator [Sphingobacteriaceae bacterium]|nr:MAG: Crp/Fnr family transcriptional regulator [Sphingobacteriaceae bacterium]
MQQQLIDNAFDSLKKHILKRTLFTDGELTEFCSHFTPMLIKKKQFIVQPDFAIKYRYYVATGVFRAYVIGDEGQEHTIQFAVDDWWITDYNSYILQQPATQFIVALEDSVVLKIEFDAEKQLKKSCHAFETYFRILAEATAAYMARRVIINLTKTAEQRYEHFVERYPAIANKVPQYMVASFLGMTTEYLSKIRNQRITRKS